MIQFRQIPNTTCNSILNASTVLFIRLFLKLFLTIFKLLLTLKVRKRELDEKKALFESIKAGKDPAAACVIEDEEPEATPDLEIQVPKHKVKLIVGPGGERIKSIQRKSRTRIQVYRCTSHIRPLQNT